MGRKSTAVTKLRKMTTQAEPDIHALVDLAREAAASEHKSAIVPLMNAMQVTEDFEAYFDIRELFAETSFVPGELVASVSKAMKEPGLFQIGADVFAAARCREALPVLIGGLKSRKNHEVEACLESLEEIGDVEAVEAIRDLSRRKAWKKQANAVLKRAFDEGARTARGKPTSPLLQQALDLVGSLRDLKDLDQLTYDHRGSSAPIVVDRVLKELRELEIRGARDVAIRGLGSIEHLFRLEIHARGVIDTANLVGLAKAEPPILILCHEANEKDDQLVVDRGVSKRTQTISLNNIPDDACLDGVAKATLRGLGLSFRRRRTTLIPEVLKRKRTLKVLSLRNVQSLDAVLGDFESGRISEMCLADIADFDLSAVARRFPNLKSLFLDGVVIDASVDTLGSFGALELFGARRCKGSSKLTRQNEVEKVEAPKERFPWWALLEPRERL